MIGLTKEYAGCLFYPVFVSAFIGLILLLAQLIHSDFIGTLFVFLVGAIIGAVVIPFLYGFYVLLRYGPFGPL